MLAKYLISVAALLNSLQKAEAYLEPKQASMIELFSEYTHRFIIFAIKAPS